jgi:hypothetical protein
MKRIIATFAVAAAVCLPAQTASAGTIEIQFTGLNARYDGFDLYDAGAQLGGSQNPAHSDPLTSVGFLVDGVSAGTLATQVFADFAIVGVGNLPVGGGSVSSPIGGFFDLLTSNLGGGLGLDFDSFQVAYNSATSSITGTGAAAIVSGQALPFGLIVGTPVQLSFVLSGLTDVTTSGGFVTGFTGLGSGRVSATTVPEPVTLLLLGTGLGALLIRRRHRSCP